MSRLATAVGAVSRVCAAAIAFTGPSSGRTAELRSFDALTAECRARPDTPQGQVPGLAPAPGSLSEAVSRWCSATCTALQPREVDARIMHTVPADMEYLHAASVLLLGASGLTTP